MSNFDLTLKLNCTKSKSLRQPYGSNPGTQMANWVSFANALKVKEKNTRSWNMNSEKWNGSHLHGVERSRKTGSELLLAAVWVSGSCQRLAGTPQVGDGGRSIPEKSQNF